MKDDLSDGCVLTCIGLSLVMIGLAVLLIAVK
jgi:hypothetical protein